MRPIIVSKRIKISLELADFSNLWLDFKGKKWGEGRLLMEKCGLWKNFVGPLFYKAQLA